MGSRIKTKRLIAFVLAAALTASVLVPMNLTANQADDTAGLRVNTDGYANPYVTSSVNTVQNTDTASGTLPAPASGIYYLRTTEELNALAAFSRTNSTEGMVFSISAPSIEFPDGFSGIGSAEYPFSGSISGIYNNARAYIYLDGASCLFNYLSSSASVQSLLISNGTFAQNFIVSGTNTTVDITDLVVEGTYNSSAAASDAGLLFSTVTSTETASASLDITGFLGDAFSPSVSAADGSAGGLIGAVRGDVSLALTGSIPVSEATVSSVGGDAGAVVGGLYSGAALTVGNISVTGATAGENDDVLAMRYVNGAADHGGAAGGVIGRLSASSSFTCGTISVSGVSCGGGDGAGGIIGSATDSSFTSESAVTVADVLIRGGVSCGGYAGALDNTHPTAASNADISAQLVPTNDTSFGVVSAGGLFGSFNIGQSYTAPAQNISATFRNDTNAVNGGVGKYNICIGGAVGLLSSDDSSYTAAFGGTFNSAFITSSTDEGMYAAGGIAGLVSSGACLKADSAAVVCGTSTAGTPSTGDLYIVNYGGAVGYADDSSLLRIHNLTVNGGFFVRNIADIPAGAGGVVGHAGIKAAICFSGATVLGTNTFGNTTSSNYIQYSGQLVGYQDCSLIFSAADWTLTRCTGGTSGSHMMDDIGNYGEVLRGNALGAVTLADDNSITVTPIAVASTGAVTIGSIAEYTALAITLNSHGEFSAVQGISKDNYSSLLSANISVTDDIDLTGTGVTTLTRSDLGEAYRGTLNGGNHTVTLAIGETYGTAGNHGNGESFGAQRLGMFAALNGATVKNITIDGLLNCGQYDNNIPMNDRRLHAGALAGSAEGTISISGTETDIVLTTKNSRWNNADKNNDNSYFGGLLGTYTGSSLTLTDCTGNADIHVMVTFAGSGTNKTMTYLAGGLVGHIKGTAGAQVDFTGTALGGTMDMPSSAVPYQAARLGGLAASIDAASTTNPSSALALTIDGLTVTQSIAEKTVNLGGGLLGYEWENIDAELKNSSGTNSISGSVQLSGSGSMGGLVYKVTGRMSVANTNLGGTFTGSNSNAARSEGLIVTDASNLYLVVDKQTVNVTGTLTGSSVPYDELAGFTRSSSSGGIVSIETGAGTGIVSDTTGWRNPWGTTGKLNKNTRYYYNAAALDIKHDSTANRENVSAGAITSREDWLLWNILTYTANSNSNMPAYYFSSSTGLFAVTALTVTSDIDLTNGFCLYPTSVVNGSFDFGGHTVTFDNAAIDELLPSDKTSQHYLMQTGLLYSVNGNVTATDLTLSGNIGRTDTGSGALISGTALGSHSGTSTYKVIELNISDIELNALSVNGFTSQSYAPLLIDNIRTCAELNLSGITQTGYTAGTTVASSLIGDVGFINESGDNATHLRLNFSEIVLEALETDSIFSRASLLNSFSYLSDGSSRGVYNFNETDDWTSSTEHPQQVTYGEELTAKRTEYLDQPYKVNPESYRQSTVYNFSDYLPYVFSVDTTVNKYTIDVNIKGGDLTEGCGTYEDPYIIKTSDQLINVYRYINTASASAGWIVNCPNDTFCNNKTDHTPYTYNGSTFPSNKMTPDIMSRAYFVLGNDITLSAAANFSGLGDVSRPFDGVFVGNDNTLTLNFNTSGANFQGGFVNIASGCVLKDINIVYNSSAQLNAAKSSYFGGAIGKVIGGDNVIDDVTISFGTDQSVSIPNRLIHVGGYIGIVEAGGVVFRNMTAQSSPSIISSLQTAGDTTAQRNTYLYCNPYIGRVLDGYAVAEPSAALDNTNKNYYIPTLSDGTTKGVSVNYTGFGKPGYSGSYSSSRHNSNITITSAEGMFAFAAALNCGALSSSEVYAYNSTSRVRNALYSSVGNVASASDPDYLIAVADNTAITGPATTNGDKNHRTSSGVPYLVNKYFDNANNTGNNNTLGHVARTAGGYHNNDLYITADCDMSEYKNSFRGIGGRYTTNATKQSSDGSNNYDRNSLVGFYFTGESSTGGISTVTIDMQLPQYYEYTSSGSSVGDPYPAKVIGLVRSHSVTRTTPIYESLNISGIISQPLYDYTNGTQKTSDAGSNYTAYSCGGFMGALYKFGSVTQSSCTLNSINANDLTVSSPGRTGAIVGYVNGSVIPNQDRLILNDCTYDGITINSGAAGGGLVGYSDLPVSVNITNDATLRDASIISTAVTSSTGTAGYSIGGIIGHIQGNNSLKINADSQSVLTIDNASLSFTSTPPVDTIGAGGVIGYANGKTTVNNVTIQNSSVYGRTVQNAVADITGLSLSSGFTGCAGGIAAYIANFNAGNENSFTNCTVTETDIVSNSAAGGIVGRYEKPNNNYTAAPLFSGCAVSGGNDGASILSGRNTGGIIGLVDLSKYVTGTFDITMQDISVSGMMLFAGNASSEVFDARASGLISSTIASINLTATDPQTPNSIDNCKIIGMYIAGVISKPQVNTYIALSDISVDDCTFGVYNSGSKSGTIGSIINTDSNAANTIYLHNTAVTGNSFISHGFQITNFGGLQNTLNGTMYASNVLYSGNTVGYFESSDGLLNPTGTPAALTDLSGVGKVFSKLMNTSAAYITAYHSDHASSRMLSECPSKASGSQLIVVYADYNGTAGSTQNAASLGAQVPVSPASKWVTAATAGPWYGDGAAAGIPQQILGEENPVYNNYTASADLDDNIITLGSKTPIYSTASNMPMLYISGSIDDAITDYLDLLTNGGFSAYRTAFPASVDASAASYSVDSSGITANVGNNGSLAYTDGEFSSAQQYDNLDSAGGHFTVASVTFTNTAAPDGTTSDFTLDIPVYFPQVLTVNTNVSLKDHEEYLIPDFIDNQAQFVDTYSGGTFTAYLEYVYNELRVEDTWNYNKFIKITDIDGRALELPAETRITLIDLNNSSRPAYYYETDIDRSELNLLWFTQADEEQTQLAIPALNNLPSYTGGGLYGENDNADFGIERYLAVIDLPEPDPGAENTQKLIYYINADLDPTAGDIRNVILRPTHNNQYITVWPKPVTTGGFSAVNGQTQISSTEEISVKLNLTTAFSPGYSAIDSTQYAFVRYYLLNSASQRISFPAGTVITVNGNTTTLTAGAAEFMVPVTDNSNQNIDISNDDIFDLEHSIAIDFNGVPLSELTATFPDGYTYSLYADYLISSDVNNPSGGIKSNYNLPLTSMSNVGASLTVTVADADQLHLGINPLDPADETNNGIINYNVTINISECSPENIRMLHQSGTVNLTFKLYKKGAGNVYGEVTPGDYLETYQTTLSLTAAEKETLCTGNYVLTKPFSIKVEHPEALSSFANYRWEVTASCTDSFVFSVSDYFIYSLAKIKTDFIN